MASTSSVSSASAEAKFRKMTEKLRNASVRIFAGQQFPWTGTVVASKSGGTAILTHCLKITGLSMEEVNERLQVMFYDDSVYDANICCCLFKSEIALIRVRRATPAKYVFNFAPQNQWELTHQQPIIGMAHPEGSSYRSGTSEICSDAYYNPHPIFSSDMILFDHRLDFVAGCSGAAIINEHGNIIGLQSGGYAQTVEVMGSRPFDILLKANEKEQFDAYEARQRTMQHESLGAEIESINNAMKKLLTANFSEGSFERSDIKPITSPTSNMKIAVHIKYINIALRREIFNNDFVSPLQNLIENYFLSDAGSSSRGGGTPRR